MSRGNEKLVITLYNDLALQGVAYLQGPISAEGRGKWYN